ncbi:MAG: DUF2256 domain-containing protein [Caldimonas sp.]
MPGPRRDDVRPEETLSSRPADVAFKGNKLSLPSKRCVACSRTMSWRKRWSRSWDEVKFCSDACRRNRAPRQRRGE